MFITDHNKIISYYPTISVIRLFSLVGCLFYFADQWVFSLSVAAYNHSVVATVCWNAVTSVKNISSCGPQKSTVIVSFLWSTVRCLLRTDHNRKVKPPISHAPTSKETVFRKIHFILQTSECFRWVSLTYNCSVVATVCWNAVTSVKNISSCGPQMSTVIVSFLWSTVRCLLRTYLNKMWSLP